jgi:tetratricopeptide (TPR) repeat protein
VGVSPDCYLVHWRGREGWVKRDNVVLGDERVSYFAERARQGPSDAYARRVCGQFLLTANWLGAADAHLEAAARLAPNDVKVHQARAILLATKRDLEGVRAALGTAERNDPSDPVTYAMRAVLIWQSHKERDKAVADFDKALRLAPHDETLYFMRSKYWQAEEDHTRALADLDTCIRLWPDDLAAHVERAELLAKCPDRALANPKEAVVSARRACELTRWENATHVRRLARACELAGDNDEAARWREKAGQIEGSNSAQLPPLPSSPPGR